MKKGRRIGLLCLGKDSCLEAVHSDRIYVAYSIGVRVMEHLSLHSSFMPRYCRRELMGRDMHDEMRRMRIVLKGYLVDTLDGADTLPIC
jgi:hypothetical protein